MLGVSKLSTPPGAIESPNIWRTPATYEIENRAVDPDGLLTAAMREIGDWADRDVLDIGCGTGFHLPLFAATARSVVGVEPHPSLATLARRRVRRLDAVRVLDGTAQELPVAASSVDVAHARWAYFFGPGCEPGLLELSRVMRRGGVAYILDNDKSTSTFGRWFREGYPWLPSAPTIERFWSVQGWTRKSVTMRWLFESRADLEAVVRIEFAPEAAERILASHDGVEVDYAVNLWWRRF